MEDAHRDAAVKGGSTPKTSGLNLPPIVLQNVADVIKLIEETVNLTRNGTMPVNTANYIGYLSGIALKAMGANFQARAEVIEAILAECKS